MSGGETLPVWAVFVLVPLLVGGGSIVLIGALGAPAPAELLPAHPRPGDHRLARRGMRADRVDAVLLAAAVALGAA